MTRARPWWCASGLVACLLLWTIPAASAHEFRPATLSLSERAPGVFAVRWTSDGAPGKDALRPVLPAHCAASTDVATHTYQLDGGVVTVLGWTVTCGRRGLDGAALRIEGLDQSTGSVFVRVRFLDRAERSGMVHVGAPSLSLAAAADARPGLTRVLATYVRLGVGHIALGVDHLLFVLALVLLVGVRARALVATITAFTLAHSATLCLAVLGLLEIPSAPVEVLIALSIAWVAFELVRDRPSSLARRPWLAAFGFGLLHGLGFAGALASVGLPADRIPLALLGFNLGVELGQLGFVAGLLALYWFGCRVGPRLATWRPGRLAAVDIPAMTTRLMTYIIGGLACYFALDRIADMSARGL